jgi:hypothetical protein
MFSLTWTAVPANGLCKRSKEACRTGKAAKALRLLDESPLAERWRPLREALAAAAEGSSRYLNGVAPDVP